MRWTRAFVIVLTLLSLGCARGDWTTETLTLIDVTGTWEGSFAVQPGVGLGQTTRWVLQQKGGKVRGEVQGPDGMPLASIEGLVNGEVFSWQTDGRFPKLAVGGAPSRKYRGESTITLDEMSGPADGLLCPCRVSLRRVGSDAGAKKTQ